MLELEKAGFSVDSSGTLGPEIPMGVGLKSFATLLLISAICTRLTDFRAYSLDGWGRDDKGSCSPGAVTCEASTPSSLVFLPFAGEKEVWTGKGFHL